MKWVHEGRLAEAVKLLRKRAGLSRGEARDAAELLRAGGVLPEWPRPGKRDLAIRVADLKEAGRRKEAVFVVRIEREMDTADAEAFVNSV